MAPTSEFQGASFLIEVLEEALRASKGKIFDDFRLIKFNIYLI